jgi:hypothetical protein
MKKSDLAKSLKVGIITLSLSALPLTLPAFAQTTPDAGITTVPGQTTVYDRDDGFDWGWLGLLGLLGLAGLAGKKREEPVRYSDPEASRSSSTRY